MLTLVLAFEVLVAMPLAKYTMCWMPAPGVVRYEVREAVYSGRSWTPVRWSLACVANTPCCVDGVAVHRAGEVSTYYDYRSWIVLGYDNTASAGRHVAQSVPLFVDYNVVGRRTSIMPNASSVATPTLTGVTP